jgi:hypothetical protein
MFEKGLVAQAVTTALETRALFARETFKPAVKADAATENCACTVEAV